MSVQLILHPQNYSGVFNAISGNPTQAIVNGISFTNLDNTETYTSTSGTPYVDTITNAPPSIINTWYRYRVGASAYPVVVLGDLVLNSLGNGSSEPTGIYQKMSNLTIGQQYTITINIGTQAANGSLANRFFDGLTPQVSITTFSTATSIITQNFYATNTEMTYMLAYYSTSAEDLTISSISALPIGTTTAEPILSNGQVILDLYEDENIPLTLSVDNFKNSAEKVQSYSKAFNLPATKRNNKIFDQVFEVTRYLSGGSILFNPYRRTQATLKQDGLLLFEGFLRLLDITDKDGEISYNVNLYSDVIAFADLLKDSTFRELDFTELEHDYNKTQIKNSWNDFPNAGITYTNPSTSGFRSANDTVKYPFVNWNNQMPISDGTDGISGNPQLTSLEQAFRPFINIKYLIDRIFQPTPFTYESTFFGTADFEKLYMDFNWGSDNAPVEVEATTFNTFYLYNIGDGSAVNYATNSFSLMHLSYNIPFLGGATPPNYNDSTNILTSTVLNESYDINYDYRIENTDTVDRDIECQWLYNSIPIDYSGVQTIAAGGTFTYSGNFSQIMANVGDTLQVQFKTDSGTASKVRQLVTTFPVSGADVIWVAGVEAVTSQTILQTLRGEIGQWEFLKGLITMFNLVTMPDPENPNNILIEPYSDVFITPALTTTPLDWTEKIDASTMKLKPLTDLNKNTIFKFVEDDDDFAFTNYKNQVGGHLYGSKKYDAGNEFNILDGEDEIIAEPFAATVVKSLMSQYPSFIIPQLYAMNEDGTSEGFDNSPRIMYNNGIKDTGASYYIPVQNGVTSSNETDYLQFSHYKFGGTSLSAYRDFHFGDCQLLTNQVSTPNNLFNLYWLPYFNELYNINTRTMDIKVNLTASDISTFKFNLQVMIKNRIFRVNKIDYKPNDLSTVEFILIP